MDLGRAQPVFTLLSLRLLGFGLKDHSFGGRGHSRGEICLRFLTEHIAEVQVAKTNWHVRYWKR